MCVWKKVYFSLLWCSFFFLFQYNILKPYMYMQHICFIFPIVRSNTHEKHKTSVQRSKKLKEHTFICYCNTKCSVELTKKKKILQTSTKKMTLQPSSDSGGWCFPLILWHTIQLFTLCGIWTMGSPVTRKMNVTPQPWIVDFVSL